MRGEAMSCPATLAGLLPIAEGVEDGGVDEDDEDGSEETADDIVGSGDETGLAVLEDDTADAAASRGVILERASGLGRAGVRSERSRYRRRPRRSAFSGGETTRGGGRGREAGVFGIHKPEPLRVLHRDGVGLRGSRRRRSSGGRADGRNAGRAGCAARIQSFARTEQVDPRTHEIPRGGKREGRRRRPVDDTGSDPGSVGHLRTVAAAGQRCSAFPFHLQRLDRTARSLDGPLAARDSDALGPGDHRRGGPGKLSEHFVQAPYWAVVLAAQCCGALTRWSHELDSISRGLRAIDSPTDDDAEDRICQRCGFAYRADPSVCEPTARRTRAVSQIDELLLGGICTSLCAKVAFGGDRSPRGSYCLNHRRAYAASAEERRERELYGENRPRPFAGRGREGGRDDGKSQGEKRSRREGEGDGGEEDPDPGWWTWQRRFRQEVRERRLGRPDPELGRDGTWNCSFRMKPPRPRAVPGSRPGRRARPCPWTNPWQQPLRSGRAEPGKLVQSVRGRGHGSLAGVGTGHGTVAAATTQCCAGCSTAWWTRSLGERSCYVARADRVLAALADIAEDRVGRPSLSSALMELAATLSRQTSVRDALALLLAPSSTEAAPDIICSSYVRRKWGLVTDVGWALLDTIRDLRDGLARETERCERALRGEAEAKRALESEERERKMWRVDGRIEEERMKHGDELRIVRQSSRKDIDELQTQMADILIGHAKQKDVLQEKNLTLQKALEEMANELRTSQERCAGTVSP
ncbi:hypothetical protein Q5P01_021955 [Channa striata]|uniref:Uncharacterized protein n=1 Tax=Channa striata TaxID=64152 RepID=A0AA88IRN6_CHASR|nr:hypothetical protein Q5P01_021955 [Channa striata]